MKGKTLKKIIIISIVILFIILCGLLFFFLRYSLKNNEKNNSSSNVTASFEKDSEKLESIEDVIKKYDSKYIENDNNNIYVEFSKDLYDEDGTSNKDFFDSLTKELIKFYPYTDFYIIDNQKKIKIFAAYDKEREKHIITINGIENYYDKTTGKNYTEINNIKDTKVTKTLKTENKILATLENKGMKLTAIGDSLGEGKEIEDGYISYLDGEVKLKKIRKNVILNLIYSRKYAEKLFGNIDNNDSLEEIHEQNPDNCFGSVEEGYLGYRTSKSYFFIYDDEISIYPYSYVENKNFDDTLTEYIEDRDFEKFINLTTGQMPLYDYCKYNFDEKSAEIMYSIYGFEININKNNPKGIIFYNNYYFTEKSKRCVKDNVVTFFNDVNSIEKVELNRRKNS